MTARRTVMKVWPIVVLPWAGIGMLAMVAVSQLKNHAFLSGLNLVEDLAGGTPLGASYSEPELREFLTLLLGWTTGLGALYVAAVAFTTTAICVAAGGETSRRGVTTTAMARTPKMVLTYLYCYMLPVLLSVAAITGVILSGGGVAGGVLVVLLCMGATLYWAVRYSLAGVAVAGRKGLFAPITAASRAVRGRWWAVLLRLLLLAGAGALLGGAIAAVTQIGVLAGANAAIVLAVLGRVLSTLLGTTLSVSVQIGMLEALETRRNH